MNRVLLVGAAGACAAASVSLGQPTSVVGSPHNLSASGLGPVRAMTENEVCIFCHAPHNSSPVRPLWNRQMPTEAYTIYGSRALAARPGQPTGASKMCLSCHDGTIAVGMTISRGQPILMSGGVTTMPAGAANLGTDLSDDHPISFRFDTALVGKNVKLKSPTSLPAELRLDSNSELQCTTCHDAHNNSLGNFLVMRNDNSEMCKSCHDMGQTTVASHQNCDACHQPHTSPSGPYLLKRSTITSTCLRCHDGSVVGAANISTDLAKTSRHDTGSPVDPSPPAADHVSCTDCHEPHTMGHGAAPAPDIHPNFGRIDGLSISGSRVSPATSESQVCYKCHADTETRSRLVSRKVFDTNTRLQFSPSAISFHPVEAPGRNMNVSSLLPGWTVASRMSCSTCHGSEGGALPGGASGGAASPTGTHGSMFAPVLVAQYDTQDLTTESTQAYALCYQCHDRANILSDQSFPTHRLHIVDQRTPCAACHDSHGISSVKGSPSGNTKLINFATSIVFPDPGTGRMEFVDKGMFAGQCFLSCHGTTHSGVEYPSPLPIGSPPAGLRRSGGLR
jgi:predicted CXXCH cytochrome family protein